MKAKITFTIDHQEEEIDLEDYGHDENTKWSDLTDEEKNEITDSLSVLNMVYAKGEEIKEL